MKAGRLLLALACTAATAVPARGQQAMTIDDAVREALDHNLALVAERYSVAIARARIVTAGLRPNPVFTYDLMLPNAPAFENGVSPRESVFRGDVVLEGGGKRERRIGVAEEAATVAELQLANTMRSIVFDVQNAFVDVLLAKANLALARESLSAFDELVRVNVERVRTGDLARMELSRSELAALQFQNDVRRQEARLATSVSGLKTLLGRTGPGGVETTGDLRRDALPIELDALRRAALERRPDVLASRQEQARSSADVRLQIAQGKVDYTVSAEFHRQHQPVPTDVTGNVFGVYASVPVPIFNRNQGEIERARQEERQAAARVKSLETNVLNEVDGVWQQFTAARDILGAVEGRMLEQARGVRAATEYSYRRGDASFVEVLDAVRAFNETMQSYNEARADYARSLYAIDSIAGRTTP